jgi:hypothetical protein
LPRFSTHGVKTLHLDDLGGPGRFRVGNNLQPSRKHANNVLTWGNKPKHVTRFA